MNNNLKRLGIVFVISGPSGTGKSTLCKRILERDPGLRFSVSCTTRSPRTGEEDGKDYYFTTKHDFQSRINNNAFLEHAEVHGELYGTLKSEIEKSINVGEDILLDIDIQGVANIQQQKMSELWSRCFQFIFVGPPSFQELERRLRTRGTEGEKTIQSRLNTGIKEMKYWKNYDYLLLNLEINHSMKKLLSIIHAERLKASRIITENPWSLPSPSETPS